MHKITEDHTREKGIQGVWRLFGQIRVAQQSIVEGLAGAYDDFVIYNISPMVLGCWEQPFELSCAVRGVCGCSQR